MLSTDDFTAGAFFDDHNPLHHDPSRPPPPPSELIASGAAHRRTACLDDSHCAIGVRASLGLEFTVRYVAAVKAGQITLTWTLTSVEPKPKLNGHLLLFQGDVRSDRGEVLLTSHGLVLLARSL